MGWSDQSNIFTFRTRETGAIHIIIQLMLKFQGACFVFWKIGPWYELDTIPYVVDIYLRTQLLIFADYSSYNPGYFGKDRNLISKFEWILSHNAHEIQLDVFFRFTLWQRQSGARGSNDENISSSDLLFPFWKSVKEDRGVGELICSIFVSCLNSKHQYFSLLESKDCMHNTRMFQFHSSLFIIAL